MRAFPFPWRRAAGLSGLILLAAAGRLRAEDSWIAIRTPHFAIFSDGSEAQARGWAEALESFTRAMSVGFPGTVDQLPFVTVVIFRRDADFQRYKPWEAGRPAAIAGLFARTPFSDVIGLDGEDNGIDVHRTIQHEAVHWFFSTRARPMPLWTEEGIAEVYSTLRMADATHAVVGGLIPGHVALLRTGIKISLADVFSTSRTMLHYNETNRANYFYAESWLMAHYALFGSESGGGAGLDRFLDLLNQGRDSSEAFHQAFGADFGVIQGRLQQYLVNGRFQTGVITLPPSDAARHFVHDRPSHAEMELALGGLLTVTRAPWDARPHLIAAAQEAPADPRAWEQLADLALIDRDLKAAIDNFQHAVAAGSRNYLAYFHLAALELHAQSGAPAAAAAAPSFSPPALLRTVIELRPDFLPAYQDLAGTLYTEAAVDPRDGPFMDAGRRLFPGEPVLAVGSAVVAIKSGERARGRAELTDLLAHPTPALSPHVAALARYILKAEAIRDLNRTIAALAADYQYPAIAATVDTALKSGMDLDAADRARLGVMRQRALGLQRLLEAQRLAESGDLNQANRLLSGLADDASAVSDVRAKARQLLGRIEAEAASAGSTPAR
jgi:hypothetical protein